MKQGTLITRVVVIVLSLAVAAYIGFTVWDGLTDPYRFIVSYAYEMDDGVGLEGFVVRTEQVVEGRSALVEIVPNEGEKVAVGGTVALVYDSAQALEARREARGLELQLEQLQYAMRRNDTVGDGAELDAQLVRTLAGLRSAVSGDDLSDLEEQGLSLRSLVVKRAGDLSTSSESVAALQLAANQVEAQLERLNASAAKGTHPITVSRSGLFSGQADGLETVLTPAALETMTAAGIDILKDSRSAAPAGAVGKLITDSTWYYAAPVDEPTAKRLEAGKRYTLDFSGDFDRSCTMTLERLGDREKDGRRLAVFSCDRWLGEATLLRLESATLVFERYTGVRVPDRALRVLDNGDGTTRLGVFTLVGRQAEFKPVEVIREGDGFYLLKGTATDRRVLRPGDVVVLSNQELYDGKVVVR